MSSDDIVISARNLTKAYRLYDKPFARLRQALAFSGEKYYREFTALESVGFDIRKGEIIGIVGRNGSGKSTLLQIVCGIRKRTSGTLEANGRISALLELGAGFHPEFTGRENVYMQGAILGITREQMEDRFAEIEAFADIGGFIDQPVRTYSSGMFVRLAFAVSISVDPDILVVDEALAVGDAAFQSKCFAKFRELHSRGKTILFVTHDLNLVVSICDRALLLDGGHLVADGASKQVIDAYRKLLGIGKQRHVPKPSSRNHAVAWAGQFQTNPGEVRYGTHQSEVLEAGIFDTQGQAVQLLSHAEEYLIKLRVAIYDDIPPPIISFVIKDSKGVPLCGTTTQMEGIEFDVVRKDDILSVTFRQPMFLNPGSYLLSLGSQGFATTGEPIAYDHRTDYLAFEVVGSVRHGIFSPGVIVEWESEREPASQ